jgi:hypothetical protein
VSKTKYSGDGSVEQEQDWEVIHEPKSFIETFQQLKDSYLEHATSDGNDSVANFLREIRRDAAVEMLNAACDAHESKNFDHAWYFLVQAADAIGYLIASQNAVYPRGDEADLRSSLRTSGRKGGKMKGENPKKIADEIAEKLRSAKPPNNGWNKATLRTEYNNIIASMDNYNDVDRKWRALLKRENIQSLFLQDKK